MNIAYSIIAALAIFNGVIWTRYRREKRISRLMHVIIWKRGVK